jgi:putative endonuclease
MSSAKQMLPPSSLRGAKATSEPKAAVVMAGLVPAIHALQYFGMAGGYVYILTNRPNGILYVGVTNDLVRRVFEHRSGFVEGFTKRHKLKRLVYFERFDDIRDAIQREHNIKHWPRAWKVRMLVAENPTWNALYDIITR